MTVLTALSAFLSFGSIAAKPPQPPTDHLDPASAMDAIVRSSPIHMAQRSVYAVSWDPAVITGYPPEYVAYKEREWEAIQAAEAHLRAGRLQMASNTLSEFLYQDYGMNGESLKVWLDANLMMGNYWEPFYVVSHNLQYTRLDPRLILRGAFAASHLGYQLPQMRFQAVQSIQGLSEKEDGTPTNDEKGNLPEGTSPRAIEYLCAIALAEESKYGPEEEFYLRHAVSLYPNEAYGLDLLASALYVLGKYEEATAAIERALQLAEGERYIESVKLALRAYKFKRDWVRQHGPPPSW